MQNRVRKDDQKCYVLFSLSLLVSGLGLNLGLMTSGLGLIEIGRMTSKIHSSAHFVEQIDYKPIRARTLDDPLEELVFLNCNSC